MERACSASLAGGAGKRVAPCWLPYRIQNVTDAYVAIAFINELSQDNDKLPRFSVDGYLHEIALTGYRHSFRIRNGANLLHIGILPKREARIVREGEVVS